jgi:UDP-N-acetylglucosamine diphosphorylase/glucosamine-1-phosphate N-acetyltransferase
MKKALSVVVMAAGKGTRMNNPDVAKVMNTVADKPMIDHVVDLALQMNAEKIVAVVGWQKDSVIEHMIRTMRPVTCVEQSPQLGTGHAVMQSEAELAGFEGDVLVLSGDVPLLTGATIEKLVEAHQASHAAATVLTTILDDASGYGRIVRNEDGYVVGIVEHKDATEKQRTIREINSGIYVFDRASLFEGLKHISPHNAQQEYYLTDVFDYFWKHELAVQAVVADDPTEVRGVNTVEQLDGARAVLALRG